MTAESLRARYETLLEISESIAAHQSLPALLHALAPSLARLMSFAGLGLMLYEPERRVTKIYLLEASIPARIPAEQEFPAEETPTSLVLETLHPFYSPDLELERRFPVVTKLLIENGVRSYCVLPLFTERRQLGSLAFGSVERNAYTAEEVDFMGRVARQVAVAVENTLNYEAAAGLNEELARERDRLRLLLNVNNAVVAHLDTESLFQAISGSLLVGVLGLKTPNRRAQ